MDIDVDVEVDVEEDAGIWPVLRGLKVSLGTA